MDTGNANHNYEYYNGYEDETEICLSVQEEQATTLHIWEGYFDDIFDSTPLGGKGWSGFTRDIQQFERTFFEDGQSVLINTQEYLDDLKQYTGKLFRYEETAKVFDLVVSWLEEAISKGYHVEVIKK